MASLSKLLMALYGFITGVSSILLWFSFREKGTSATANILSNFGMLLNSSYGMTILPTGGEVESSYTVSIIAVMYIISLVSSVTIVVAALLKGVSPIKALLSGLVMGMLSFAVGSDSFDITFNVVFSVLASLIITFLSVSVGRNRIGKGVLIGSGLITSALSMAYAVGLPLLQNLPLVQYINQTIPDGYLLVGLGTGDLLLASGLNALGTGMLNRRANRVAFIATGLPKGSSWAVKIGGVKKYISGERGELEVPNGTSFEVEEVQVAGKEYIPNPMAGVVKGNSVRVKFKEQRRKKVKVRFIAEGLPRSAPLNLNLGGRVLTSQNGVLEAEGYEGEDFTVLPTTFGQGTFVPSPVSGKLQGGEIKISFSLRPQNLPQPTPPVTPQQGSVTPPTVPSLGQWRPELWKGRRIGDYQVLDVIGKGGTSYVLKVSRENKLYAMKIPIFQPSSGGQSMAISKTIFDDIAKEFSSLSEVSEKSYNIVRLYAIGGVDKITIQEIQSGNTRKYLEQPPYLVMELMEGGDARELTMKDWAFYSARWPSIVGNVLYYTASALQTIHSSGFVHLDVKPHNLFFSRSLGATANEVTRNLSASRDLVKLGDLGSAKKEGERFDQITTGFASIDQVEAYVSGTGAKVIMDIFSLGATGLFMLTRTTPYTQSVLSLIENALDLKMRGGNPRELIEKARLEYVRWWREQRRPDNIPQKLWDTVMQCLNPDPLLRPSSKSVYDSLAIYSRIT